MSDSDGGSYYDYEDGSSEEYVSDDPDSYYKLRGFHLRDSFLGDMIKMLRDGSFNDVCIKLHDGEI